MFRSIAAFVLLWPVAGSALKLEELVLSFGKDQQFELRLGPLDRLDAMDEHGRRCDLHDGRLVPLEREDGAFWQLEAATESGGPACRNGMIFKIDPQTRDFIRHDHGFNKIFQYYARRACRVDSRPLNEAESELMYDCYFRREKWAAYKAALKWYLGLKTKGNPRSVSCTTELLIHQNLEVKCSHQFKKLADQSAFLDVIVLKTGHHEIRGAGSNASNYILDPGFDGVVDLRGHSYVFHLPHHRCHSPDIFRGCIQISDP